MDYLSAEDDIKSPNIAKGDPQWLEGLNPEQREAVQAEPQPLLILAGAGTGKTSVLTRRLAWLLYAGYADIHHIYCVTFTNKAAGEMTQRIESMLSPNFNTRGMWLGTFHAMGAKLLRRHANEVGLNDNFTIIDSDDQLRLIKQLLASQNIDDKRNPPKIIAQQINQWKDSVMLPDELRGDSELLNDNQLLASNIYPLYQQYLKEMNAVDFGDLLLTPIILLRNNPHLHDEYRNRFRHILVDEYQDTNKAQYQWLKLLAQHGDKPSITCVGDDDQSIYGWRGADVKNILSFEKDFKGAKIIRLQQNYRSSNIILKTAGAIIAHNQGRLGKELWSDNEYTSRVNVNGYYDAKEEAQNIATQIMRQYGQELAYKSSAILVRTTSQTRLFEEVFNMLRLPYRLVGNTRFYEREEIRDAVAYLRLIHQQSANLAWQRIINKPARSIGKTSQDKIMGLAQAKNISYFAATQLACEEGLLSGKTANNVRNFCDLILRWAKLAQEMNNGDLTRLMLEESGYIQFLQQDTRENASDKLDNLNELCDATNDFDNLQSYLDHIALVLDRDKNDNNFDAVNIMTIHAAKGLEFDHIYLPGWEEGLFPIQRSIDEGGLDSLEEERRLAYVAITRAKKNVMISCCQHRMMHGNWLSPPPSRFIRELPKNNNINFYNIPESILKQQQNDNIIQQNNVNTAYKYSNENWQIGDNCTHLRFGKGTIQEIDGELLGIKFHDGNYRKLIASFLQRDT